MPNPLKFLWNVIPLWLKVVIALMATPIALQNLYKAWHIDTVRAEMKPFKDQTSKNIDLIYYRQDELQRSFNYLEERIDRHNDTVLKALLHNQKYPTSIKGN